MSKVITGKGRFSYFNAFAPKLNDLSGKNEYSLEFIIPKTDVPTITALKAAMKAALDKKWPDGKYPKGLKSPLKDGDTETKQDNSPLGEQYHGQFFIRCKASEAEKPGIVDAQGKDILSANDVVSGDYGRVSVTAYAYSNAGNNGVAFWLNNVQFLEKGEPLGSKTSAADDFGVAQSANDASVPF